MKKAIIMFCMMLSVMMLFGCRQTNEMPEENMYINITAQQAKEIMDSESDYIILDVRAADEYSQGHIPGAMLIPHTDINVRAKTELPDKDQLILVYCRSG